MLNINIICVGKLKEKYLKDALNEYIKRLSRYCKLTITELPDEKIPDKLNPNLEIDIKTKESNNIINHIKKDSYIIALDLTGKQFTSEELKDEDGFVYYDIPLELDIQRHIFDECQLYEVPYELAMAVMYVETGGTFDSSLRSKTNDSGLFQINDVHKKWLRESGINDLYNPYQNSSAGIWILKDALSKGDNIHTSLMVYNMGHGGARKLWKKGIYSSKYSRKVVETMDLLFQ